jgi:hypothetical protein
MSGRPVSDVTYNQDPTSGGNLRARLTTPQWAELGIYSLQFHWFADRLKNFELTAALIRMLHVSPELIGGGGVRPF